MTRTSAESTGEAPGGEHEGSAPARASEETPKPPESGQPAATGPWARRVLRSGWLPVGLVALFAVGLLLRYQTPPLDIGRYALYLGYGLVVPGTLLYRAVSGRRPRSFVEDVAAGTAVGYAAELLVYLGVRAAGVPLAVAVWPTIVIVTFAAVPRLRRYWRSGGAVRAPTGWAWSVSGIVALLFGVGAAQYYRGMGLTWPWSAGAYFDSLYQLALAGELKHHVPPVTPYVTDQPLDYHWFVHAHLGASSWVSGVELQTILFRLFGLPMIALLTVLIALCAQRMTGRWWPGAIAAFGTFLVGGFSPYQWSYGAFFDPSLLQVNLWVSPTQTFGSLLFAALVLLVIGRLRGIGGGRGEWILIAFLAAAVMGAKATFLPLIIAGLALVILVQLIRRRLDWTAAAALGITLFFFTFASYVVFGSSAHALQLAPLQTARFFPALFDTGISQGYGTHVPVRIEAFVTVLAIGAWLVRAAGIVGLLPRKRWLDRSVLMLAGIAGAGIVLTIALRHPGVGQIYFLWSSSPYLAILSATGLAAALPAERQTARVGWALAGAAAFGALVAWVVPHAFFPARPPGGGRKDVAIALVEPIAVIAAVMVIGVVALVVSRRRVPFLRGISLALVLTAIVGLGIAPAADQLAHLARIEAKAYRGIYHPTNGVRTLPKGAVEAGRWLRDHSATDDPVATNTHCRQVTPTYCDNRHFWVSGFTERRVLVESWGYSKTNSDESWSGKGAFFQIGYWDPKLLADNDNAFRRPSEQSIALLRDKYHVRWLFVDDRYDRPSADLGRYAKLRFHSGDCEVYSIS